MVAAAATMGVAVAVLAAVGGTEGRCKRKVALGMSSIFLRVACRKIIRACSGGGGGWVAVMTLPCVVTARRGM